MTLRLLDSNPSFLSELTKKWWHWFYGARSMDDLPPYTENNVTFLPSIIGDEKEPYHLSSTVNHDNSILINVAKWMSFGLPFMSDDKLREMAEDRMDTLSKKSVMVDDKVVESERVMTDVFQLDLKRDIINPKVSYTRINHIRKGKYKVVGNGYWLFIKLEKGKHHVHTIATCESGKVNIDVHHEISIV